MFSVMEQYYPASSSESRRGEAARERFSVSKPQSKSTLPDPVKYDFSRAWGRLRNSPLATGPTRYGHFGGEFRSRHEEVAKIAFDRIGKRANALYGLLTLNPSLAAETGGERAYDFDIWQGFP